MIIDVNGTTVITVEPARIRYNPDQQTMSESERDDDGYITLILVNKDNE